MRTILAIIFTLLLAGSAWGQDRRIGVPEPPRVQLPPPIPIPPAPPLPPNPPLYLWPPVERIEIKPCVPITWVWEVRPVPVSDANEFLRKNPEWEPIGAIEMDVEVITVIGGTTGYILQWTGKLERKPCMILRRQVRVKEEK